MNKQTKITEKTYRFSLTFTNEGHSFYTETFKVNALDAEEAQDTVNRRENTIVAGLMKLLPEGNWDCEQEAL